MAGFAIRGRQLVVYLIAEGDRQKFLLSKLGKHSIGKSCLHFKKVADLDPSVLEQLVAGSVAEVRQRYGYAAGKTNARATKPVQLKQGAAHAGQPRCVFIANGELQAPQVRAFLAAAGVRSVERGESVRHTHGITIDG